MGGHAGGQAEAERREWNEFQHGIRLRTDLHGRIDAVMQRMGGCAPLHIGLAFRSLAREDDRLGLQVGHGLALKAAMPIVRAPSPAPGSDGSWGPVEAACGDAVNLLVAG